MVLVQRAALGIDQAWVAARDNLDYADQLVPLGEASHAVHRALVALDQLRL